MLNCEICKYEYKGTDLTKVGGTIIQVDLFWICPECKCPNLIRNYVAKPASFASITVLDDVES